VEVLPDGSYLTLSTEYTSPTSGKIELIRLSYDGKLLQRTYINPDTAHLLMVNHDFCLLEGDTSIAITAEVNGKLGVMMIPLYPTEMCGQSEGDTSIYDNYGGDSNYDLNHTPHLFTFDSVAFTYTTTDYDGGRAVVCDDNAPMTDRDTTLEVCAGDRVKADASFAGATAYKWLHGDTTAFASGTAGDTLRVRVEVGCRHFVHTFVVQEKEICPCTIVFPDAFTPNRDNTNDKFGPISECQFLEYSLQIYNRWGAKIWQSNISTDQWDGTYYGQSAPLETYIYVLSARTTQLGAVAEVRKGEVSLLR
jgi:gliding motility-associated-like protein